jgi:hypothetical protein
VADQSFVCLATLEDVFDATQLAVAFAADTFKLALFDGSLVIDPEAFTAYGVAPFNAGEVAASGGYATGGSALSGKTFARQTGTGRIRYNTSGLTITNVTGDVQHLLHYDDTLAGNNAWYVCDLGSEFTLAGEDLIITPDANGWFRYRA